MKNAGKFSMLVVLFLLLNVGCDEQKDGVNLEERIVYFENNVTPTSRDSVFTVATYNIKLGFRLDDDPWNAETLGGGQEQLEALADVLREIDADVIALQEVPRNRYNSIIKDYIEAFAQEMNMNFAFGSHGYNEPYITPARGEWGCAILTKFEIVDAHNNEVFYEDVWTRRSVLSTVIKMNDSRLIEPYSLHWYPNIVEEENTAKHIFKAPSRPIVMGDFNKTGPLEIFAENGLEDVDSTYTLHAIDRIFVRPHQFEVLEIGVVDTLVSDHLPSWARLRIR